MSIVFWQVGSMTGKKRDCWKCWKKTCGCSLSQRINQESKGFYHFFFLYVEIIQGYKGTNGYVFL